MSHDHGHTSQAGLNSGSGGRAIRRKLWWAFWINLVFLVVEAAGGIISGSLALLADAGHMLTDVAALALAIIAAHLAEVSPSPKRTFGMVRAEVIGAFINGASLVVIVGFIAWESFKRLGQPYEVDSVLMLVVAVLGLAANLASTLILIHRESENVNLQGAFLHMLGDTLGSAGAIVAGIVIMTTGWTPIDVIVSLLIAGIILWGSIGLLRKTVNIIMNATPEDIDYGEVRDSLLELEHFEGLHDLHIWTLSSGFPVLSVHISLDRQCSDSSHWHDCLDRARRMLHERFGIVHSTIQLEPPGYDRDDRPL